ncbi:MAG TPA: hypothetical protein VM432_11075 [Bdellovibrionales bacterium]|nr:hypothetical protein [Bdellovibrionales bacterium]
MKLHTHLFFAAVSISAAAWLTLTATKTSAQIDTTECYKINVGDDPIALDENAATTSVWCYRELSEPVGSRLVFKIDAFGKTRPELSMLVGRDGTIVHASLLRGELTIHRLKSNWSPLPAPLEPPTDAEKVKQPISPMSTKSTDSVIEVFRNAPEQPDDITVRMEGVQTVTVKEKLLPWRGYWFPLKSGRMHNGSNSPTAKFDRYVAARTGTTPGAQRWERSRHVFSGIAWSGHCNGWAAASIMRREPAPWTDPFSEETFTTADMKGLLIERDYCPELLFFGHRYRGKDLSDIYALDFHKVLTYYIGKLGKPVLMDIRRDAPVENRVVSGYKMTITEVDELTYDVVAELAVHEYDTSLSDELGVAPIKPRTYKYRIWTDAVGEVVKASWQSANPDFIWVPLAPATCSYQNPAVSEEWIQTMGKPTKLPGW